MKVKISYTEEECGQARELESMIQNFLERPRIKRVDGEERFKKTYLTTRPSGK